MQEEVPSKLMQEYAEFFFQDPPIQRAKIETIGVTQTEAVSYTHLTLPTTPYV